jgi:ectoine hydroxylase-related dioxygenase (phytanoyl-CoA dioxygenase family)
MLTAWIPFHDCPRMMGPLLVIDGSHKWKLTSSTRTFKDQDLTKLEEHLGREYGPIKKVPMVLERGQVSFHNCLAIHASDVNVSQSPRLSLALHMQDDSNRYREYLNEHGVPWQLVNDRMCRRTLDGTPDYTDPAVFPTLWDERN